MLPRFCYVGGGVLWQGEVFPTVALYSAVHGQEVLAFDVGREQSDAEFIGERQDAVLGGADPLPADLDHGAPFERVVQEPSADATSGLQDEDRNSSGEQVARGNQSGQASPYHYDVDLFGDVCLVHPLPFSSPWSQPSGRFVVR